jgi:hypothetical protein
MTYNYREQAERCLRLASLCTDQHVSDMLRGLAADYLERVVQSEMPPSMAQPQVQAPQVQQAQQMQQSRAKDEAEKD